MNKRNFDKEAATWDANPVRVKLAKDISSALLEAIAVGHDSSVLDFGCGTGLLTLRLSEVAGSVTAIDSSEGMLGVLRDKVASAGIENVRFENSGSFDWNGRRDSFDVGLCSMTLHHIESVPSLLARFFDVLKIGGLLCIADLEPEGGRFHDDNTGVFHFGFERSELERALRDAGFEVLRYEKAAVVAKPARGGPLREFPVFLVVARKEPSEACPAERFSSGA